MSCLIAKSTLKALWGLALSDTSQDAAIEILTAQCSARIEEYCSRKFHAADYTEIYQGTGDKQLPLRQRPINSVASVYEDAGAMWGEAPNAFPDTSLLVAGDDYALMKDQPDGSSRCGMLWRIDGVWPKFDVYRAGTIGPIAYPSPGNVKVTYNAGFATIPYDLQQAAAVLIANMKRIIRIGQPVVSEGWEDYNYAVASAAATVMGALPPDTAAVLSRYRNQPVG